ncbi:MAG: metallopeptidase family protein [Phycisphaerales bacterium]
MTPQEQARFDAIFELVVDSLPARVREVMDELPVTVTDRPDKQTMDALIAEGIVHPDEANDPEALLGLHTGVAITERGLDETGLDETGLDETGMLPGSIHVFREAILALACGPQGWETPEADDLIFHEARVTLLHEIGHHFGLDEDDLDALGYG